MKIYSIFDDFDERAIEIIRSAGGELTVHPHGIPRPDPARMKEILQEYNCVIIGTTQKITEDMFDGINRPRIIATASVGLDHILIPAEKRDLVTILNTPKANAQSVAEYTMACALSCCKRLAEGNTLYREGKNNKQLFQKPEDLSGKIIGVVGAGSISRRIMEYASFFGMQILCWTRNPEHHLDLERLGVRFTSLEALADISDVISVNLPNNNGTKKLISGDVISRMKENAIFISVSRLDTIEATELIEKAKKYRGFYVCLDLDVNEDLVKTLPERHNVLVTPHIAGGTVETRKRMFRELAEQISDIIKDVE